MSEAEPIWTLGDAMHADPSAFGINNSEFAAQYLTAAKALLRGKRRQDVNVPAFFIIRHACELLLKEAIETACEIDEFQHPGAGTLWKRNAKALGRHDLDPLIEALEDALPKIGVTKMSVGAFKSAVEAIHQVDKKQYWATRYPKGQRGLKRTFGTPSPSQLRRCFEAVVKCFEHYQGRPYDNAEADSMFTPWLYDKWGEAEYVASGGSLSDFD